MNAQSSDVYTVADLARIFDVHPHTVYRWIHSGILPASRIGHQFYFTHQALCEALLPSTPKEVPNETT